jgi:hypothetical protein
MQITIQQSIAGGYLVQADQPLRLGQLVTFLPSNSTGYVAGYARNKRYQVLTPAPATDTSVEQQAWWTQRQEPTAALCLSPNFFIPSTSPAQLAVQTSTSKAQEPGSLGWDLWFRPEHTIPWVHVLKGNDLDHPGQSLHSQPNASWPKGHYLYRATQFYKTSLVPLGTVSHQWTLTTPAQILSTELYL